MRSVYKSYWADTSSNRLIRESSADIKQNFKRLLDGEHIKVPVDEQIIYDQLDEEENSIWSLLLAGGYLKVVSMMTPSYDTEPERFYHGFVLGLAVDLANQ